jgi:hypothetical protein
VRTHTYTLLNNSNQHNMPLSFSTKKIQENKNKCLNAPVRTFEITNNLT